MNLGNKIKKIISINEDSYTIKIKYVDGLIINVDLSLIFKNPKNLAAEIIKGGLFTKCYIESGALAWPNGFELCPDSLRMKIKEKRHSKTG